MKSALTFLISILITITRAQEFCGISGKSTGLVVNGTQSEHGKWPWLVAIYTVKNDKLICGGSLVSPDAVITAAHCIQNKKAHKARKPNEIILKIGRYDLSQNYERGGVIAYANDIYVHPNWKFFNNDFDADIAVIKLTIPVTFVDIIFPICLFRAESDQTSTESGFVAGYGKSERANTENIARELEVKIRTNEKCFIKKPLLAAISSVNTFCAGKETYSGVCSGDSGSGLYVLQEHRWYLKGIVSASLLVNKTCDTSNDAVYTNVPKFIDWIESKIGSKSPSLSVQSYTTTPRTTTVGLIEWVKLDSVLRRRKEKEVICYIPNWTMYRNESKFSLDNFKPELCTTAVYMFANLNRDGAIKSSDPHADLEENNGLNGFKRFTALKKTYPHLRLLLSIGGWKDGVEKYSRFVASVIKRKGFALQSAEFLKKYDFDGLDFYWDYPGDKDRQGSPKDKQNFVLLLKDINAIYKQSDLFLSVTVRAAKWITNFAYNLTAIGEYADMIHMMNFDHSGPWFKKIGYPAPLYQNPEGYPSIEESIQLFRTAKVPLDKLIVGIPFFGRTFLTSSDGNIGDESENLSIPGPIIQDPTYLSYGEICKLKKQKNWILKFDKISSQMIGKYSVDNKNVVAVYDSPRSVANKVKYAMEKKVRGVWAWSMDMDDFEGDCEIDETTFDDFGQRKPQNYQQQDFPLLRTMNIAMDFLNN